MADPAYLKRVRNSDMFDAVLKKSDYVTITKLMKCSTGMKAYLEKKARPLATVPETDGFMRLQDVQNTILGSPISFISNKRSLLPQEIADLDVFSFETIVISNLSMSTYMAHIRGRLSVAAKRCTAVKLQSPIESALLAELMREIQPEKVAFRHFHQDPNDPALQSIPDLNIVSSLLTDNNYRDGQMLIQLINGHREITIDFVQSTRTAVVVKLMKMWRDGAQIIRGKRVNFGFSNFFMEMNLERVQILNGLYQMKPQLLGSMEDKMFTARFKSNGGGPMEMVFNGHLIQITFH